ncbi:HAD superfamily, subfamily IIIB acid phosphatase [Thalictrum thalictroides]|uniref:HAD superfamily, subfamily IIIB acid phosphatase n=1 Tax=Thalictrum thalictroides TaxID=46969 RepID=A0A7J6X775_THATH|nr:HAD superfamily, subfamily IIIB acid phosphatase [Thalictrum thalictroides]
MFDLYTEQMESGIYITPYAAAMFVAAMVTIGVLFITIVATLTVMLRSCQNRNPGVLQLGERSDEYNYCKMFILHAELNRLKVDEFPSICKTHAIHYFKGAADQYLRDLNWSIWVINSYFNSIKPEADGLDVVLVDLNDILSVLVDKDQAGAHILELYTKLQASGWSLIFIARNPEKLHNVTMGTLISSGIRCCSSLIMRSDYEMLLESCAYFSSRRAELQKHLKCD